MHGAGSASVTGSFVAGLTERRIGVELLALNNTYSAARREFRKFAPHLARGKAYKRCLHKYAPRIIDGWVWARNKMTETVSLKRTAGYAADMAFKAAEKEKHRRAMESVKLMGVRGPGIPPPGAETDSDTEGQLGEEVVYTATSCYPNMETDTEKDVGGGDTDTPVVVDLDRDECSTDDDTVILSDASPPAPTPTARPAGVLPAPVVAGVAEDWSHGGYTASLQGRPTDEDKSGPHHRDYGDYRAPDCDRGASTASAEERQGMRSDFFCGTGERGCTSESGKGKTIQPRAAGKTRTRAKRDLAQQQMLSDKPSDHESDNFWRAFAAKSSPRQLRRAEACLRDRRKSAARADYHEDDDMSEDGDATGSPTDKPMPMPLAGESPAFSMDRKQREKENAKGYLWEKGQEEPARNMSGAKPPPPPPASTNWFSCPLPTMGGATAEMAGRDSADTGVDTELRLGTAVHKVRRLLTNEVRVEKEKLQRDGRQKAFVTASRDYDREVMSQILNEPRELVLGEALLRARRLLEMNGEDVPVVTWADKACGPQQQAAVQVAEAGVGKPTDINESSLDPDEWIEGWMRQSGPPHQVEVDATMTRSSFCDKFRRQFCLEKAKDDAWSATGNETFYQDYLKGRGVFRRPTEAGEPSQEQKMAAYEASYLPTWDGVERPPGDDSYEEETERGKFACSSPLANACRWAAA
jgi:hypothetical protein